MKLIIQKFGGTSVATEQSRTFVISKILKSIERGFSPIVVVSAMGRIGAPYATDTLLEFIKNNAGDMTAHDTDLLLSCGEIISAVTIATMLNNQGIKAKAFTGGQAGIITNENYTEASLLFTEPKKLLETVQSGIIPVVAGFQGVTKTNEITTLGRGGSDTSASILGVSVKASKIEIYTDVDGIMTTDPRICDRVHKINNLSYNEVFQMADSGAKVIHPRAVEYAMRANIPLVVKNTFSDDEGSFIMQNTEQKERLGSIVTALAHRSGRVQYMLTEPQEGLLKKIADKNISIDLINIFQNFIVFTINELNQQKLEILLNEEYCKFTKTEHCAKITAIGEAISGVPGIMAKIATTLTKKNIKILQTTDSLTTISCLIKEEELKTAINALHEEFDL
ncbi:aspartate kinase [Candidatus Epulonipiscioides gigas]|nr:aspartate kinase [Epulopiscium sp. SCG-C07WGA-EpuloA2]ONI44849.1 aspartate kinase [Epulopiscium sp. SCG-C07WGA-EpuloA2]